MLGDLLAELVLERALLEQVGELVRRDGLLLPLNRLVLALSAARPSKGAPTS